MDERGDVTRYCELQHKCQFLGGIYYWKCRKNGEFPLKNDDFVLKNGRLLLQFEATVHPFAQIVGKLDSMEAHLATQEHADVEAVAQQVSSSVVTQHRLYRNLLLG